MRLFLPAQIGGHCAQIETEALGVGMPNPANLIHHRVIPHDYSSLVSM